ncbi:hypothetical protein evm_011001 [Chilo suppressalis]|nr:hypothetical protein evm_011001 [Chilo suppressalis]
MALRNTIGSYARLQLRSSRGTVLSRWAHGQISCGKEGSAAPECAPPPCQRPPPPACRARPPRRLTATRVVCCPPPAGDPPPCSPPCAPQSLTCADALPKSKRAARAATCGPKRECGLELDRVARRLARMERHRRLEYEKEVAAKKACREPFPAPVAYSLSSMRSCCRATDGRDYALSCRAPPPPACGPARTPPPPQCVELVRDNECRVRAPHYVDPCAHTPRTIVHIDRSGRPDSAPEENAPAVDPKTRNSTGSEPVRAPAAGAKRFTKRLMESLSLSKAPTATCPRRTCDAECEGEGAKRAGDSGWCSSMKPPPAAPPACREPSPADLLARRPPSRCGPKDSRRFHTAARTDAKTEDGRSASQIKSDAEKLDEVLQDRENYAEAGRGRIVVGEDSTVDEANETAGLDICIPPGAEKLSVRVSLDKGCGKRASKCETTASRKGKEIEKVSSKNTVKSPRGTASAPPLAVSRCRGTGSELPEKRESWLSIKSLLSGYRKGADAKRPKKDSAHTSTCPTKTQIKSSFQTSPCEPSDSFSSSKVLPTASSASRKSPVPPIPCYPPFPSSVPENPQPCKSPADTSHKAPISSPCKPSLPPPPPMTDCPPSKPKTDEPLSKPKTDCPSNATTDYTPSKINTGCRPYKSKTDCPPSKAKTDSPPCKAKTDCPPYKSKTDSPPFIPKTNSPPSKTNRDYPSKAKTDCPPSKPKDPCSTNKMKFLTDIELQLQTILLKR